MGGAKVPKDRLPAPIEQFIRMEANLCTRPEKLEKLFGITDPKNDPRTKSADDKMYRWRRHPMYDEVWKDEKSRQSYEDYSTALQVFRDSMKQGRDKWLALNAAINMLNNANKRIYGNEDSTVTVQVSGLPDIGSPEQDETDG